ncbi:hypothetical protein [Enterococcus sp. LJL90]
MTKKSGLSLIILFLTAFVILTIWVPATRIFFYSLPLANIGVTVVSIFLCVLSVVFYRQYKSKLSLLAFVVGLSPIFFVIIILISFALGTPLAP